MRYRYRAGLEQRTRRGKTQWRVIIEKQHVDWSRLSTSRWLKNYDQAVAHANTTLDALEHHPTPLEYV